MRATVNGKEVFLKDGELPAVTLSINSLTDPSKIAGTKSTTINILATVEAKRVMGTEFMAQPRPTDKMLLRIGNGGVDDFASEVVIVEQNRNEIKCVAVSGNASWFEYAKGVNLSEFDFGMSDAPFGNDQIKDTWTNEDSLLYFPMIDFGAFEDRTSSYGVSTYQFAPGFRAHKLIETAFGASGYTVLPMGTLAAHWKKFVVIDSDRKPLTAIPFGSKTGAFAGPFAPIDADITEIGSTPGYLNMEFFSDYPALVTPPFAYTVPYDGLMTIRVEAMGASFDPFDYPTDGSHFFLSVLDDTSGLILATVGGIFYAAADSGKMRWWHTFDDVPVVAGHEIRFTMQCAVGTYLGGSNVGEGQASLQMVDALTPTQYIGWNATDLTYYAFTGAQSPIRLTGLPPDLSLMDLLKSISDNQCLVYVTRGQYIEIWYDDEYQKRPISGTPFRDWSTRMDVTDPPAKVTKDKPRNILFRFKEDDGDKLLAQFNASVDEPGYGNTDVRVGGIADDLTVQLPFAPSIMGEIFDGCVVPILRDTKGTYQVDERGREPRLLIADGLSVGNWKFSSLPQTQYPNCCFVTDARTGIAIHFDNAPAGYPGTVPSRWDRRISAMVSAILLEADFFIRDSEIRNFDHGLPTLVNDGSGARWYYVQEITQHKFDRAEPTRCTLVQIPGKALSLRPGADVSYPVPPVPVCGIPDLSYEFIDNEDGTFNLEITMASSADFTPGDVYVEYDGTTPMGGDWSDDWSDDFNT